ncbi:TIGR03013 family XrtA/PEP-CTERM system glycosyltransferase [Desulfovibrio oxyclinae]|uniref:TIGR03013 family XrtA/PEP-CTERM system glycosyltransferase n=1 Tax=Desulfovibrio oxyclinae TaxID=63560 RepID=UPI00037F9EFD|nr:TIGR03013 family XrtA/PEP-CTERM system glycosyltransferase [Desulfovibrio oxyclinae]
MVTYASIRVFKSFVILALVLGFMPLAAFRDMPDMLVLFETRGMDLAALAGIIILSSVAAELIIKGARRRGKDGFNGLLLSLIIATNAAFLIHWQVGMFTKLEEVVLQILCFFGATSALWIVASQNVMRFPGMVRRVVIVGNGAMAEDMMQLVKSSNGRYELRDYIECRPGQFSDSDQDPDNPVTMDILNRAKKLKAHKIVVSLSERRGAFPLQEVLSCKLSGMEVLDAPGFYEQVNRKLMLENITPSWFIFAQGFRITGLRRVVKRVLDIVLSLFGLMLVGPFLPIVALFIKLDSRGPALFKQVRVGRADREFLIYKFRTMRCDAEKDCGAVWSDKNDSRITRLGNFLRKTRIDELPQLFNVLTGEMSLVGPRPERPEFVRDLKKIIPYYSERHFVKPGITGWAQVRYPYGSSVEDSIEKLRYDLYYIKNYTLLLDFRIMFATVAVMARKMGR